MGNVLLGFIGNLATVEELALRRVQPLLTDEGEVCSDEETRQVKDKKITKRSQYIQPSAGASHYYSIYIESNMLVNILGVVTPSPASQISSRMRKW